MRYWAAYSLEGEVSPRLAKVLPGLIHNPQLRCLAEVGRRRLRHIGDLELMEYADQALEM